VRPGSGEGEIKECDDTVATGLVQCSAQCRRDKTRRDGQWQSQSRCAAMPAMSVDVGGWPGKLARGCCVVHGR
jgi:hypothetical protein